MIPFILASVGGYLIGSATKDSFEDGGMMAKGGVAYPDLSLMKPPVVNDSETLTEEQKKQRAVKIDEIEIVKKDKVKIPSRIKKISSSKDAYTVLLDFWIFDQINIAEHFNVLLLNKGNKPIGLYQLSKGGIDGTVADVELICAVAVKTLAKGVIVSHNHPSGNLDPSNADKVVTENISKALALFGIRLLDSLIVTPEKGEYFSFADNGISPFN